MRVAKVDGPERVRLLDDVLEVGPVPVGQDGAAAAAAFTPFAALAGGQSEGTGLVLGIDDGRETTVLTLVFGSFFWLYYNWAKDQPDSDSDFFAEYDERRK